MPKRCVICESTGRDEAQVALVEAYCKAQGLWRDAETPPAEFTAVIEIDLSAVEPSVSGPSRPQDRLPLAAAPAAFRDFLSASTRRKKESSTSSLKDGDVVIAAITSCTNTSNPSVMIGAGLLARNAVARGLKVRPWVKTSLSPGSRVVADYLAQSGLQRSLDALGFQPVGFGCMTCMGNSGPLPAPVAEAIEADGTTAVAVLSGNRNFEGRIHPSVRANFLASPPLVVAYALAGSVLVDLARQPLGEDGEGRPVYLHDIWPDGAEIRRIIGEVITPALFRERYATMLEGTPEWRALRGAAGTTFAWDPASTFIRRPPFFDDMAAAPPELDDIRGARVLAMFGDMFTTDHISPIGAISKGTPAADYLASLGIAPRDFVNYAARRLNHDVMIRGTFANVRVRNEMTPEVEGSSTAHYPDGERMPIHVAAARYRDEGVPLVVIAGTEYGAGSSRDWAAKGTRLLGVRAVIAESFERIHRSNLVGMGVLPLQFPDGVTRRTLGLTGSGARRRRRHPRLRHPAERARMYDYPCRRQARHDPAALAPGHDARGRLFPQRRPAAPRGAPPPDPRGAFMSPRKKLRELLAKDTYTIVPGAHDTLTARLVQVAGFDAVYLTGGGYSRASGYPDVGLLTMTEITQYISRTVEAVDIPVIADMDAGYGNALNVIRSVREYEKTGVAAFHLEDQVSPKKCGHYEGKQLVSKAEMIGKIKAAVDTRRDADMVVIARSDARAVEGLQASIDRVNAYLDAGADVGFVEAPQSAEELAAAARQLKKPALCNIFEGGKTPVLPARELAAMGYRIGIYPSQTHRAAIAAAKRVLAVLKRDGDTTAIESELATFNDREEAVNAKRWRDLETKYLKDV